MSSKSHLRLPAAAMLCGAPRESKGDGAEFVLVRIGSEKHFGEAGDDPAKLLLRFRLDETVRNGEAVLLLETS